MKLKMPVALASQKNTVYYLGEIEYLKKWLVDQVLEDNDDAKRMILLGMIKQVFDQQVYIGPRCNEATCTTKGKCALNRHLNIILIERSSLTTEEKGWRSIMIHAYKKGDLEEAVFETRKAPSGNPIKIEFNAVGVLKEPAGQSGPQMQNMVKGGLTELEDAEQIAEMKDLMKKALTDECQADVMALQTEGYEEQ